jgi:hypothetical protein
MIDQDPEFPPMTKKQLRNLALTNPDAFRRAITGARRRELAARHLLLHLEQVATASVEDRQAFEEYVAERQWKSLYGHDRRMYRLLRAGAEKWAALNKSTSGKLLGTGLSKN